ncbi:hypothetical protein [Ammoniphilus oxalaticus]|uniref:hypothetical protein n=1 Tax=Ammoniphilus oxalaticus TaxID=66863 RepID=UPI0014753C36|nr:hypothetical protein [Ammoniphilus oxalaticus]
MKREEDWEDTEMAVDNKDIKKSQNSSQKEREEFLRDRMNKFTNRYNEDLRRLSKN